MLRHRLIAAIVAATASPETVTLVYYLVCE